MNTQVLRPLRPTRVINLTKILPLFQSTTTALVPPARRSRTTTLLAARGATPLALRKRVERPPIHVPMLAVPTAGTLTVPRGTGTASRDFGTLDLDVTGVANMKVPVGMPKFVNAATLKRMLKAKRSELLLRRTGDRWEICDDSTRIDLNDDSVEFRLGAVQIFS